MQLGGSPAFLWNTSPPFSGSKSKPSKNPAQTGGKLNFSYRLLVLLSCLACFDFEFEGDMLLRDVMLVWKYTALQTKGPYSSK
jgi:hypothetical protein